MAKRYSPKFKFQVVMELLQGDKSAAQVAKAYGLHPNTVNNWKQKLLDDGTEVYAKDNTVAEYERRLASAHYAQHTTTKAQPGQAGHHRRRKAGQCRGSDGRNRLV